MTRTSVGDSPEAILLHQNIQAFSASRDAMRGLIEAAAKQLTVEFKQRRKALQAPLMRVDDKRKFKDWKDFAPLGFTARKKGRITLELCWHRQIRYSIKGKKTESLGKGVGRFQYADRTLTRHAKAYEVALVLEVEARAAILRRQWAWLNEGERTETKLAGGRKARKAVPPGMVVLADGTLAPLPPGVTREAWLAHCKDPNFAPHHPSQLVPLGERWGRQSGG